MAKRKKKTETKETEAKELEFKKAYLSKKMHGNIKGIELPKYYKDFTKEEKEILFWLNPAKTFNLFIDVSFMTKKKVINKIEPPKKDNELKTEKESDDK